jgi:hypothetical protein
MKNSAYAIRFVTLCLSAFLYSGFVAAQDNPASQAKFAGYQVATVVEASAAGFALPAARYPSDFALAKANKPSPQEVCEARCKKAYRRCYSQGNKVGTPEVQGGQPCSEQQTTCLRACAQ